jgi:hypothetical protein
MATKLNTISNALLLIGDQTINSLDEGSFRATVATNLYDNIYEAELASHTWGFARKLGNLSQTTSAPIVDKWKYIYQLPTDLISILTFYSRGDYEVYGDKIYSNQKTLTIDYYAKVSETLWPGYFAKLMEYALAKEFAIPIRENTSTADLMYKMYLGMGQKARALDSKQRIPRPIQDAPFLNARG